jgi:hypothetical protein
MSDSETFVLLRPLSVSHGTTNLKSDLVTHQRKGIVWVISQNVQCTSKAIDDNVPQPLFLKLKGRNNRPHHNHERSIITAITSTYIKIE